MIIVRVDQRIQFPFMSQDEKKSLAENTSGQKIESKPMREAHGSIVRSSGLNRFELRPRFSCDNNVLSKVGNVYLRRPKTIELKLL